MKKAYKWTIVLILAGFVMAGIFLSIAPDIIVYWDPVRGQGQEEPRQNEAQQNQGNGPFVCFFHFDSSLRSLIHSMTSSSTEAVSS